MAKLYCSPRRLSKIAQTIGMALFSVYFIIKGLVIYNDYKNAG